MTTPTARIATVRVVLAVVVLAAVVPVAAADSTPVGPLPKATVTTVTTTKGSLVSVSVPARTAASGLVWRVARRYDARIVRQVGEGDVGNAVILVFEVVGRGRTSVVLALTRGDTSAKALRAVRYDIRAS
jgi:hypothetical protein